MTEVAGRGIGLDVVRDVTERLGGTVSVETGTSGTTFALVVPASLASLEALGVEMAGVRAMFPLDAVRRRCASASTRFAGPRTRLDRARRQVDPVRVARRGAAAERTDAGTRVVVHRDCRGGGRAGRRRRGSAD